MAKITREQYNKWNEQAKNGFQFDFQYYVVWSEKTLTKKVKMDNGDWYWFDLTWDDTPEWMFGVSYNYFCATDTQNVSWIDGPWVSSERSFAETHTPFTPDGDIDERGAAACRNFSAASTTDSFFVLPHM